jgi:hypothetical protein
MVKMQWLHEKQGVGVECWGEEKCFWKEEGEALLAGLHFGLPAGRVLVLTGRCHSAVAPAVAQNTKGLLDAGNLNLSQIL